MDSKQTVELIGTGFEVAGIIILVLGSILAFGRYVVTLIRFRDGPAAFRGLRQSQSCLWLRVDHHADFR